MIYYFDKNKKFVSLIYFYKYSFQSISVVQGICPLSGSVKVILLF